MPIAQKRRERALSKRLKNAKSPVEAMIAVDSAIQNSRAEMESIKGFRGSRGHFVVNPSLEEKEKD